MTCFVVVPVFVAAKDLFILISINSGISLYPEHVECIVHTKYCAFFHLSAFFLFLLTLIQSTMTSVCTRRVKRIVLGFVHTKYCASLGVCV